MNEPLIAIVGLTGSGKSVFALKIAKRYGGEIICADSRTIYKGMDIGTAKPSKQEQTEVRHHLLDLVSPSEPFTAADFKSSALVAIKDIWTRGMWPIMVGGSGLYVDSVLFDYNFGSPSDPALREKLSAMTTSELQAVCRHNDIEFPENYLNKRHLIRSIELGGLLQQERKLRPNTIVVGLTLEKAELAKCIEKRIRLMVKAGVLDEVRSFGQLYGWDIEAMKSNIYRALKPVIEGEQSIEEGIGAAIKGDLRLIKKQITWFRRNPHVIWGTPKQLETEIKTFMKTRSL